MKQTNKQTIASTKKNNLKMFFAEKSIHINQTGTIPCSAFGVPLPEIKWKRSDGKNIDPSRMFILPNGSLKIIRTIYQDGGKYKCIAENVFGNNTYEIFINVTGIGKELKFFFFF